VKAVASDLGYHPNDLFRSLVRKRSFTIGLLASYGRFSLPMLEGLEDSLGPAEMSVFLCYSANDPEREARHIRSLLAKRVDGIIVAGRETDQREPIDLGNVKIPVLYAYTRSSSPDALCLLPDDAQGAQLAMAHLIGLGRRNIAHITGSARFDAVRSRSATYRSSLETAGLPFEPERVIYSEWSEAAGYEAALRLLERAPLIDALFCGNDQLARGAQNALHERGLRVPEDVSVVGFDNWTEIAEAARPALTTVDMNLHELGRRAGALMLDLIDGRRDAGIQRLPCRLVIRRSCGAYALTPQNASGGTHPLT
jgi:LacI family transcriptional regulator